MNKENISNKNNFIKKIIKKDLATKKVENVLTRFPPEPNGYLHIGHAKAICLNFGIAQEFAGQCNLRFDDTNPSKEDVKYINSIKDDIEWLGFSCENNIHFASEYFEQMYNIAITLIKKEKAYVCDLSADEIRAYRGTLNEVGKNSPFRNRSIKENLLLFMQMKNGELTEGSKTLRAKIDMTSGNINLRDPTLYRINFTTHPNTGNKWCIYPMYSFAHPVEDAIEKITHSLCTLEFEDQKPLYEWILKEAEFKIKPQQIEFSRINISYTITSKRKLKYLVDNNLVNGWDDPRMPTLKGYLRRGYTAKSIRDFCSTISVSKQNSVIDISILEEAVRKDLNLSSLRRYAVLDPIKVIIKNMSSHILNVPNHPQNTTLGRRNISISSEIYIDREDFVFDLKKDLKKISPNGRVRLMNGYVIDCENVISSSDSKVISIECSYIEETLGGKKPVDDKKIDGIIHWVDAKNCLNAEIRIYDKLFNNENPSSNSFFKSYLNSKSLIVIKNAKVEKSLENTNRGEKFQFNRIGYFVADREDHSPESLVFNRTVTLKNNK